MHTIYSRNTNNHRLSRRSKKKSRRLKLLVFFLVAIMGTYLSLSIIRFIKPLPAIAGQVTYQDFPTSELQITPPSSAQSAIGTASHGVLKKYGDGTPRPIASVSKVITALVILDKKPLKTGEQGELITLTQADVDNYNEYVAKLGSVVPVEVGEQISQYQALQALLLPSANNIADTLAIWTYGSLDNYIEAANSYVQNKGLNNTTLADASGFSPQTVSTAEDLIKLADIALSNPIISEIVAQKDAIIPVAGVIKNVNFLVGQDNIDGIKTGNTDEAGYCLLASATIPLGDGASTRIFSVVLGAESRPLSMTGAHDLINQLKDQFVAETIKQGTVFGKYHLPWGESVDVVLSEDVNFTRLKSEKPKIEVNLRLINIPVHENQTTGDVDIKIFNKAYKQTPLVLNQQTISAPTIWHLKHAFFVDRIWP